MNVAVCVYAAEDTHDLRLVVGVMTALLHTLVRMYERLMLFNECSEGSGATRTHPASSRIQFQRGQ